MPRKARIDAPGALHHIIVRGIERKRIFADDQDRNDFLARFDGIVIDTKTTCLAWALIPNHVHLLLLQRPIADVMRRLARAIQFDMKEALVQLSHLKHPCRKSTPSRRPSKILMMKQPWGCWISCKTTSNRNRRFGIGIEKNKGIRPFESAKKCKIRQLNAKIRDYPYDSPAPLF